MRRSHPSSIDPKGLAGINFDVCSIASTETASTVAGRGRGAGNTLRKRRGGGASSGGHGCDDDDCVNGLDGKKGGVMGLYSDPFSSMFSPTSGGGGGGLGGLMGARRLRNVQPPSAGGGTMGPPDARRSHSALIGNKQNTHFRSSVGVGSGAVQSVRVEISPTGSPVSPIPSSVTANIAPTMNAFRRCLLMNKGRGGCNAAAPTSTSSSSYASNRDDCVATLATTTLVSSSHGAFPSTVTLEVHEEVTFGGDSDGCDDAVVVEEEHHIFLFDNDDDDGMPPALNPRGARDSHCGGKERRNAVARRQQGHSASSSVAPYAKPSQEHSANPSPFAMAGVSRKQRRACRSRYDIDESDGDEGEAGGGKRGGAIYYVQVSHSALTPRDGPDDLMLVPQMPLLPSSVATAVVDEELAVLEHLML